ncbi:MAG: class I SAM-dependent methyltransferase [Planctomycetes bacterium]|nr:class I SAM-dependent methyltransferase [Planctomycetota bacterium]
MIQPKLGDAGERRLGPVASGNVGGCRPVIPVVLGRPHRSWRRFRCWPAGRLTPRLCLCVGMLLASGWWGAPRLGAAPQEDAFLELAAVCRPLAALVVENTVAVVGDQLADAPPMSRSCSPLPADARMLAYEEHAQFLHAVAGAGDGFGSPSQVAAPASSWTLVRRLVFLRPDVFIVDDFVMPAVSDTAVVWTVQFRRQPRAAGRQWLLADGQRECLCETLYPRNSAVRQAGSVSGDPAEPRFTSEQRAGDKGVRWLHMAQPRPAGTDQPAVTADCQEKDGQLELTVTTSEQVVRLTLPPPGSDAGWIGIQAADGTVLMPRRPLASGVLPHGPEGVKLIERWDSAYRGERAGWDTGAPAPELKRVVESGLVKPGRTVTFGCGTGASDIYLASKGFEVTAIDVSPTALGIAQKKAEEAGVHVRWVLADVLHLPDLGQFDFFFDRGCYHHVRYVDAAGFQETLRRLARPGTRGLILSCDSDRPPGVREQHMRDDFAELFDIEWLRDSGVENRDGTPRRESWSLMLRRK